MPFYEKQEDNSLQLVILSSVSKYMYISGDVCSEEKAAELKIRLEQAEKAKEEEERSEREVERERGKGIEGGEEKGERVEEVDAE